MPYVPVNVILDRALPVKGTISLPYPPGKNEGSFFGASNHTLAVDATFYRAPRDFLITTSPDRIVLTWRGERPVPAGALLNLMLDEPGSDFYYDAKLGITVMNMVHSNTFMVNLGAPRGEIADLHVQSTMVTSSAPLTLTGQKTIAPRNVVIHSDRDNSSRYFRVEGEDMYFRTMVEEIPGPNMGRSEGKKAFATVTRIIPSGGCEGHLTVGSGNRLGLPVFLPAPGFLLRALLNGEELSGGKIVSGETGLPDAHTGDRRGTYTPPANAELDGKKALYLLLSLPNPGNIGIPDYAG